MTPPHHRPSPTALSRPRRFDAPALQDDDTLRVAARHDATMERRRYDAGFHQGHADGYAKGAAEVDGAIADHRRNAERLASLCAALDAAVAERRRADDAAVAALEEAALELAMRVAEAVIEREATDRHLVIDTIRRCLRFDRPADGVTLRIHPDDLACAAEAIEAGLIDGADVELTADLNVERGGCIVDAAAIRIDGQIGPALDRIRDALRVL